MTFGVDGRTVPSRYPVTKPVCGAPHTLTFNTTNATPEDGTPPFPRTNKPIAVCAATAPNTPTFSAVPNHRPGPSAPTPPAAGVPAAIQPCTPADRRSFPARRSSDLTLPFVPTGTTTRSAIV